MPKVSSNGALKKGGYQKKGGGTAARTASIVGWLEKSTAKSAGVFRGRTSRIIAEMCSRAVGFEVPFRKMARELDRAGISFIRTPADPPKRVSSKTEYLRARQSNFEERLTRVEKELFGKSFGKLF